MLGQYFTGATSDNRIFVYEVSGLHQNEVTQLQRPPIRNSHTQLLQVPFSRMNEVMQQSTLMQGKIVNIFPLENQAPVSVADSASVSTDEDDSDESA